MSEPGADTSPPAAASDTQPESSPPTAPDPREAEPEAEPVPPASEPEAAGPPDDADAAAVAIVRAWSTALNAGDNESAGQLFAPNAIIIQGPNTLRLHRRPRSDTVHRIAAVLWPDRRRTREQQRRNHGLRAWTPSGEPVRRPPPGTLVAVDIVVEDGSIVLWQSVPVPDEGAGSSSAV